MGKKKANRKRVFGTVVYDESAPDNWIDIIRSAHVQAFIIKHDKDFDDVGEIKKTHYHVMIMFEGVKSDEQWEEFRNTFGGVGTEEIRSSRGYARYLCHLDDPNKYQYSITDVLELGGACYSEVIGSGSDRYKCISEMTDYCREYHITRYADLFDYAKRSEPEWFHSLCDNSSFVIEAYIKSLRYDD